jgi:transcriptional regulator with XRE-family HTH domain
MSDLSEFVSNAARGAGYDIDSPRGGGRTALAEAAGISASSIGRLLSGQSSISPAAMPRLAEALKVPVSDVLVAAGFVSSPGDVRELPGRLTSPQADGDRSPISSEVIAKLRTLRQIQKVSAQHLAGEVTTLGFHVTRTMIANWEGGRKNTIPVDFLVLAAQALGTTAAVILNEPVSCPQCKGMPPAGFTCNTCGTTGGAV